MRYESFIIFLKQNNFLKYQCRVTFNQQYLKFSQDLVDVCMQNFRKTSTTLKIKLFSECKKTK